MTGLKPTSRAKRFLGRFGRALDGSTAVEFGFVALPFLTLLFATMELGLVFMVSTTLQNAADTAARRIRTGELQAGNGDKAAFKTAVCNEMAWLGTGCSTNLTVDVRTFTTFTGATVSDPLTNGAVDETKTQFTPGAAEDIVLVRVYYTWSLITPLLNSGMQNLSNGKRLISATVTFRNEPWAS